MPWVYCCGLMIVLDLETALITPTNLTPPITCMALMGEYACQVYHVADQHTPQVVKAVLAEDYIIGHNIAYDMACICAEWPHLLPHVVAAYDNNRVADTMLRAKLWDIADGKYRKHGPYSLGNLAKVHLGIEVEGKGGVQLEYGPLRDVPLSDWTEEQRTYPLRDVATTWALYQKQAKGGQRYFANQHEKARSAFWQQLMAVWGLTTDPEEVERFAARGSQRIDRLKRRLHCAGLMSKGKRKVAPAQDYAKRVWDKKGTSPPQTASGRISLSKADCERSGSLILKAWSEVTQDQKKGGDLALLRRPRIHVKWDLLKTGRTSTSPNVQNMPRKRGVRECIVPRAGYVFAAADYSSFELRTVAQVCTTLGWESALAKALNAGLDPHLQVASKILGVPYDEATTHPDVDKARQTGKVANFGFPGGLGIDRFIEYAAKGYGVKLTREEAEALKEHWRTAWPEMVEYHAYVGKQVNQNQIKIPFSDRYMGSPTFTEAANAYFQGLAADAACRAGWLLVKACYVNKTHILFDCRPVNFVHDEFIIEVPDDGLASDRAHALAEIMCAGANEYLPDVPAVAEPYLMRRWSKSAKPVYKGAKLIPWDG